jgi:hypothetical protein
MYQDMIKWYQSKKTKPLHHIMLKRNKQTQFTNTEHRGQKQSNTNPNLKMLGGCIGYSLLVETNEHFSYFAFDSWLEYTHKYR